MREDIVKTILAILVAALPLTALAEKVYVQFDGIVVPSNSPMRAGYNIGDLVSGTLLIDSLLAPQPRVDLDRFAYYGSPRPPEKSFISGFAGDKQPRDFVLLDAGRGPFAGLNDIAIQDANPYRTLFVRARSDLVSLDLVQTFDLQQEEDNGELFGWFEWGRELIERVHFRMTRFSMTPGRCRL
jgi:hypothetical protein